MAWSAVPGERTRRVPLRILYGEPIHLHGSPTDEDAAIEALVDSVKVRIAALIAAGAERHHETRALP